MLLLSSVTCYIGDTGCLFKTRLYLEYRMFLMQLAASYFYSVTVNYRLPIFFQVWENTEETMDGSAMGKLCAVCCVCVCVCVQCFPLTVWN